MRVAVSVAMTVCCGWAAGQQRLPSAAGIRVEPLRFAQVAYIDGRVVQTSDWQPYETGGMAHLCGLSECWDSYEMDFWSGAPMGGENAGCAPPNATCRYFLGPDYCSGGSLNDLTDVLCPGELSREIGIGWFWHVNGPGTWEQCTIILITGEQDWPDDGSPDCLNDFGSFYEGLAWDFGWFEGDGGYTDNPRYYYAFPAICGQARGYQMPADGSGVSLFLIRSGDLNTLPTCAQPMLWTTGEDENPPEHRRGTNHGLQYDDASPRDGVFSLANECRTAPQTAFADALCPMHMYWGSNVCDPCDVNCDGSINPFDIQPFIDLLSGGGGSPCASCAADTNLDGSVNQFDIQPFVNCFNN